MKHSFFNAIFNNDEYSKNIAIKDLGSNISLTYEDFKSQVIAYQKFLRQELPPNIKNFGVAALLTGKNHNFLIAQLACNCLGIPFLPLDAGQEKRNQEILEDLKPMLIIGDNLQITFNDVYSNISQEAEYVIFSSGSTGKPKGIIMKGEPAIHIVSQQAKIIDIKPNDKYLWLLNTAFDASLSDIYSTFVSGATLVIPDFETTQIKKLCTTIEQEHISHIDLPPSMFSIFYKSISKFNMDSLKVIVFGGEPAPETITKELAKHFQLFQAYGPTETTICSSMNKIDDFSRVDDIGIPMKGVSYLVLDNELLISGDILTLGYFNNDKLNNSKFIRLNNRVWYKTGDCVSNVDGKYFYRGRLDRQFKFHSQLICPEEIENKAIKAGADFCHIYFNDKIHMYFFGDLDLEVFKASLTTYMQPHFIYKIESKDDISKLLNSNLKFDHKLFMSNIKLS